MSLFSRWFRRAPPVPAPAARFTPEPSSAALPRAAEVTRAAAEEEATLQAAIDAGDAGTISRLTIKGSSTKVRQRAAQAVTDAAQLRQLLKDARRGNDKNVYRILSAKRDALLAESRRHEQRQGEIHAACAAIERHSQRGYDNLYAATLEQLAGRWQAVADQAPADMQQQVQHALERAREVIAGHQRQLAAEASRELATASALAEAQRSRQLEQEAAAAAAAERARVAAQERKAQLEKSQAEAAALRETGELIRKARAAIDRGATGRAAALRRSLGERLEAGPALPPSLASQLQHLDARLQELRDWKSFTVAPKRLELIQEMEALVDSALEPVLLARQIRDLQAQWRTLSKGAAEDAQADWQRFHDAAQKAYEPCRAHFEAQALVREENLRQRTALLERLAAFEAAHDWQQPDWRLVGIALREARQLWRRYSPVERSAEPAMQERFQGLCKSLQDRLDAEQARNLAERGVMIERARRLLELDDSLQAIEAVKQLQQAWRTLGPVARAADHASWEKFRQHCDAVYQRRQQEFAQYNAALESNKEQARAACTELERIAALSGAELLAAQPRLDELRSAYAALGEFPRKEARELQQRFERARQRCEIALERQRALNVERGWSNLLEAAELVQAYRLAVLRSEDPDSQRTLREAAERYLAETGAWPPGAREIVKAALRRDAGGDLPTNERTLRLLCIRAEICADLPTPPHDQALRREYQVQRLLQGMGQGELSGRAQLDDIALEWAATGPVDPAVFAELSARFKRCRAGSEAAAGREPQPGAITTSPAP